MIDKIQKWYKKIKAEYHKSGMNPVQFIYWTIRSDIDEMKRATAK